jgi:curved DNA-binding protein
MKASARISVEQARRVLAVAVDCDPAALRKAFNKAAKKAHPDHGGTQEAFALALEAFQLLQGLHSAADETVLDAVSPLGPRLEITLTVALKGGRTVTRLSDGRRLAITTPPGMRNGDKIAAGGVTLSVNIRGRPDAFVSGDDLCVTAQTTVAVLREGGRVRVKTPSGPYDIWVPKQVGTNRIVRIPGRGLPARGRHPQGALIIKLVAGKPGKESGGAKSKLKRFSSSWAAA